MSAIFGGSKSKQESSQQSENFSNQQSTSQSQSQSGNQAFPWLREAFGSLAPNATAGMDGINAFLSGDFSGLQKYKQGAGYDQATANAGRGVTANGAAAGLLNSGSLGKALTAAQSGLDNQYANNYLDTLMKKIGIGTGAGQLISGAGGFNNSNSSGQSTGESQGFSSGFSNGTSSSKNGMGSFLGSLAGGIAASDPRLKTDLNHIYTLPDGLKVYQFRYKEEYTTDDGIQIGVMADEVKELRPEALGPLTKDGYMTVNYDKIWE